MYWKLKEFEAFEGGRYVVHIQVLDRKYGEIFSMFWSQNTKKSNMHKYILNWRQPTIEVRTFLLVHFNAIKRDINKLLVKEML